MPNITQIYVAQYHDVIIAVDEYKDNVLTYMKHIRGLSKNEYDFIVAGLPDAFVSDYYPREYMEELMPGYVLPKRDCDYIRKSMDEYDIQYFKTLHFLDQVYQMAKYSDYEWDATAFERAIFALKTTYDPTVGKKKKIKRYNKAQIHLNPILHMPISEYLTFIASDNEAWNLLQTYRSRLMH